jgi:RNA polymerase sigma-70 factor (ECF subfamily)
MMKFTLISKKSKTRWKAALRQGFDVSMDINEKALFYRARSGDRQAAGILYERYYREVYQYIFYRVNDNVSAEDLTAEVFVRMIRQLPKFTNQKETFISWLYAIARGLIKEYQRVNSEFKFEPVFEIIDDEADPNGNGRPQDQSALDCFRRAMRHLKDTHKEVIIHRFVEGRSVKDIAKLTQKSERAVRTLQLRALQSLECALEKEQCL